MTDRQLEQIRTFTKKEVMSSAINELRGYIIRSLSSVTDDDRRQELMKQQRLLALKQMPSWAMMRLHKAYKTRYFGYIALF